MGQVVNVGSPDMWNMLRLLEDEAMSDDRPSKDSWQITPVVPLTGLGFARKRKIILNERES